MEEHAEALEQLRCRRLDDGLPRGDHWHNGSHGWFLRVTNVVV